MLAEFLTVIPQTPSMVLITYRPEYRGALTRVPGAQTISLAPLSDSQTAALIAELLGTDPSVPGWRRHRRTGRRQPVFRRGDGARAGRARGARRRARRLRCATVDVAEVSVPATLQATIAARIDRLDPRPSGR